MKTIVFCNDHTCTHNNDGVCESKVINVNIGYGEVEGYSNRPINICSNYKDKRDVSV